LDYLKRVSNNPIAKKKLEFKNNIYTLDYLKCVSNNPIAKKKI